MSIDEKATVSGAGDLYDRHGASITRFAASLVGPWDAQDVVHDAVAALMASGTLTEAENPRALMYRAVLSTAKSMQRSTFRRRAREQRFAENIETADPEVLPEVARAVAGLSAQQRACVFLTYWEDMTPEQVGLHVGISEGTVRAHLARARRRLREVLHD